MTTIEPVVATITVPCEPARAFELFTAGIGGWWPAARHSVGGDANVAAVVFEDGVGGRIYERWHDSTEHEWGRITVWEPPGRVAFTWSPAPSDEVDTEVEVAFDAIDGGTLVRLVHTGWEALGDGAEKRSAYDAGWPHVLTRMLDATLGPVAHRAFARSTNAETWRLLEAGEAAAAVTAAHASAWHWRAGGGPVESARADWLCARAHAAAGDAAAALRHAEASLATCESHALEMKDFDHAYAAEGMARALALAGRAEEAATWRTKATDLGAAIADPDDRAIFEADLATP